MFLSSWFPSKVHPTLGNFVQRHAEAVALRHQVHVLYVTASPHQKERIEIENKEEEGVNITIVYYRKSLLLNFFRKRKAFRTGLRYIRNEAKFDFELVHHNVIWKDIWQAWYIHKKFNTPYIITEHWTGFDKSRGNMPFLLKPYSRFFTSKASAICPVTQNLAENMQSAGIWGKYQVVPNVVDTYLFQLVPKPDGNVRFLHVSSLNDAQKNISGILRVWKEAIQHNPNIHLTIGGDGPWEPYQDLLKELAIPERNISFFGEKTWAEISELMQQSHCLLMFSNYENLPCVIVESLASGMFVISSDVGGISEHINRERGILVNPGEKAELLKAILQFSLEFKSVDSKQLRNYAINHFSKPVIADAFTEVYENALKA